VEKHPRAKLAINRAYEIGNDQYEFEGTLTIKGIPNKVTGRYSVNSGKIAGAFEFDRSKFDIRYRSASFFEDLGDKMIYDEVMIGFEVKI
jgi:polyisoprenoid-binding protein YceI